MHLSFRSLIDRMFSFSLFRFRAGGRKLLSLSLSEKVTFLFDIIRPRLPSDTWIEILQRRLDRSTDMALRLLRALSLLYHAASLRILQRRIRVTEGLFGDLIDFLFILSTDALRFVLGAYIARQIAYAH